MKIARIYVEESSIIHMPMGCSNIVSLILLSPYGRDVWMVKILRFHGIYGLSLRNPEYIQEII
jgi:hypothetical protein